MGTPAIMLGEPWSDGKIEAELKRGPHSSSKEVIEFLRNEFADMINKYTAVYRPPWRHDQEDVWFASQPDWFSSTKESLR